MEEQLSYIQVDQYIKVETLRMVYNRLSSGCGCTFKNNSTLQKHMPTMKNKILMQGGTPEVVHDITLRRGKITSLTNTLNKTEKDTDSWTTSTETWSVM